MTKEVWERTKHFWKWKNIITIKNDRQVKYIRDSKKTQLVNWTTDVKKLSSVQHRDNEIEKYETEIMRYKEQSEMVKLKSNLIS